MNKRLLDRESLLAWAPPTAMILILWIFGFPALTQYNVTWDEALGDLFFGERYLSFFASQDPVYLDFKADDVYPPERRPDLGISPFRIRPWEYYPFANTLAALSAEILSRRLGLLDVFDGFHAVNLLLAALMIGVFYRFLQRREGALAATAALGLLFTAPRIVCHLMANIKDVPLMFLYTLTAVAFFRAYEAGSTRGILGGGVLLGATLASKANALFFPAIPMGLLLLGGVPEPWRGREKRLIGVFLAGGLLSVAVMVLLWPYLWPHPIRRYAEHLSYIGLRQGYTRPESVAPAFEALLLTTPVSFLLLFAIGLAPCVKRALRRDRLMIFFLVWIGVVLGRFFLPQAINFDGVRHFLEIFPPMAAIAGVGTAWLASKIHGRFLPGGRRLVKAAVLFVAVLPSAWQTATTHPFQIAYWNILAGGPAGAAARGLPQAGDYWGMSYRLGMRWLNEHAPEGSFLVVPVAEHAVRLTAQTRLRDDIVLLPVTRLYSPQIAADRLEKTRELTRKHPVYIMTVARLDWANELMLTCLQDDDPEAVWTLADVPVLKICRFRPG